MTFVLMTFDLMIFVLMTLVLLTFVPILHDLITNATAHFIPVDVKMPCQNDIKKFLPHLRDVKNKLECLCFATILILLQHKRRRLKPTQVGQARRVRSTNIK